jgi:hypothetical protein
MKEFKAKFEKNGNDDFDVVDIFEVNGKPFKKIPNSFPLPPNIKKIRTVEIHMIQLISDETEGDRWCVVNREKYWCPG